MERYVNDKMEKTVEEEKLIKECAREARRRGHNMPTQKDAVWWTDIFFNMIVLCDTEQKRHVHLVLALDTFGEKLGRELYDCASRHQQ